MKQIRLLILLAIASFLPALFFYVVGEEGIYTISSMEMGRSHNWWIETLYGANLQRPPLMNWLVVAASSLIGWQHVLIVTRLVSIAATLGSASWLYWLCRKLFADRAFALLAVLSYLSLADLLLYRGWLSYTDPLFAFFTFGAMASLWVAATEKRRRLLLLSVALVSCAMLTKAFTAYVFYATAGVVLVYRREYRGFLLSPASLLVMALALAAPYAWFSLAPQLSGQGGSMLHEILRKLSALSWASYARQLFGFPLDVLLRLSPPLLLALYFLLRRRISSQEEMPQHFRNTILITALCFLPYWLSPQSSIRYLLPIYPLFALLSARLIWRADASSQAVARRWLGGIIAFKLLFGLLLFPYYQASYRGANYAQTAQVIMKRTHGHPLYVNDVRSAGLSLVSYIDQARWPAAPLLFPPQQFDSGFVLSPSNDPALGQWQETYTLGGDQVFLLCRGTACTAAR
ncbi:MAG: hypothetical protein GC139_07945 [Sideroxydans sp.]|nr:hypothetical protein [Sideroxydans sp.]